MLIFRRKWFVMLGYMFLIKPGVVSGIPALGAVDRLFDVFRLCIVALTLIALGNKVVCKRIKWDKKLIVVLAIMAGELWKIVATVISGSAYTDWGALMNTAGMALFTYVCLLHNPRVFFEGASRTLGLYVLLNLISVILFPGGMYATSKYTMNYFLSYRTAWLPVYFLAATVVLLNWALYPTKKNKRWCIAVIAAEFLSLIMVWSATGIFCLSLGAIVFAYCLRVRGGNPIKARWVIFTEAAAFYLLTIARAQEKFAFILVTLLKKDLTMTSRLRIWDNALKSISANLWTGIGDLPDQMIKGILGYGVTHAHSFCLDTTMRYGLIGLGILLLPIIYSLTRKHANPMCGLIGSCVIVVILTSFLVECYSTIGYYLIPIYIMICGVADVKSGDVLWIKK